MCTKQLLGLVNQCEPLYCIPTSLLQPGPECGEVWTRNMITAFHFVYKYEKPKASFNFAHTFYWSNPWWTSYLQVAAKMRALKISTEHEERYARHPTIITFLIYFSNWAIARFRGRYIKHQHDDSKAKQRSIHVHVKDNLIVAARQHGFLRKTPRIWCSLDSVSTRLSDPHTQGKISCGSSCWFGFVFTCFPKATTPEL